MPLNLQVLFHYPANPGTNKIRCNMHFDVLMDHPPFEVHPDLKELLKYFDKPFGGDIEDLPMQTP